MSAISKIQNGIEIWEGKPGSGKSYGVVMKLITIIMLKRRPVYTNLPLRFKVIRKYMLLKGHDPILARYLIPLDLQHFLRFLKRNAAFTTFREEKLKLNKVSDTDKWGDGRIDAEFEKVYPGFTDGEQANWFPPGAVFCLDELHRWFDQRDQKNEPPELLTYLSMHRHHLHWLMVMTQDRMQISLPWRRNCVRYVHCTDKSRLPFLGPFKFPFPIFFYEEEPAELCSESTGRLRGACKPSEVWMHFPLLTNGLVWRFYDSFTHVGSGRRLVRKLEMSRAGIEGTSFKPENVVASRKRGGGLSVRLVVVLLVVCLGVGLLYGRVTSSWFSRSPPPAIVAPVVPALSPVERRLPTSQPSRDSVKSLKFGVVGDGFVVADGQEVEVGGFIDGYEVAAVDESKSKIYLQSNGHMFTCGIGEGVPIAVGRSAANFGPAAAGGGIDGAADVAAGGKRSDGGFASGWPQVSSARQ